MHTKCDGICNAVTLSSHWPLTDLAFPLVLFQLDSVAQYVIETRDAVQMRAWLSDIRNGICLR